MGKLYLWLWVIFVTVILAIYIGGVLCLSNIQLCHSTIAIFTYRVWRAGELSISANGTTLKGLIGVIVAYVVLLAWTGYRHGWSGMKEHWNQKIKVGLAVPVIVGIILFLYFFISMPPEMFSVEEIQSFSQGIVVAIASVIDATNTPISTGFWVDQKGYIITCSNSQESDILLNNSIFKIGVMVPPLLTGKMLAAIGIFYSGGETVYRNPETGIKILRVYNNPFIRTLHAFAEAEDTKTHQKEVTIEKYWVPTLSNGTMSVGSQIFLTAVESGDHGLPAISFIEGRVVRLGAALSSKKHYLRLYTNIPFKASYSGAPVLNTSKAVVGIVCPTSESSSVLIPSQSLLDMLVEAKPTMTTIVLH